MSRLLMSNSEVQAICRNRNEQRNLSDKLDQLDQIAFQSKDAIQQDMRTWRKFRRDNVRNTGWSPKSVRPDPGEDVFFPKSSSGRLTGSTPNSPTQTAKDTPFTKPWVYSYSPSSHNRVYKELTKVSQNSKKYLDLNFKSLSADSTAKEEQQQPALLKHVKTIQALSRAASVLAPSNDKLLSLRRNKAARSTSAKSDQTVVGSPKLGEMARSVSTIQTLSKFTTVCKLSKTKTAVISKDTYSATDKLVKSVKAMKGLAKSRDVFACLKCGQTVECPKKEERFPKVAFAYKGVHRAQTALKLSSHQTGQGADHEVSQDEGLNRTRCCAKCQNKSGSPSRASKAFKENPSQKHKSKSCPDSKEEFNAKGDNNTKIGKRKRLKSVVSNVSVEHADRLRVAREKVSKCFEISSRDEEVNSVEMATYDMISLEASLKPRESDYTYSEILPKGENSLNDHTGVTSNNAKMKDPSSESDLTGIKGIASSRPKNNKESLLNLSETIEELDLNEDESSFDDNALDKQKNDGSKECMDSGTERKDGEEYVPSISPQRVMQVIQEEVIDKLSKLTNKEKSPPRLKKYSTLSRASTMFRLGGQRKKKSSKTSAVDIFTRIAKYMLFEMWRRRRERLENRDREEIDKSCKKITQLKFRATYLSSTKGNCQDNGCNPENFIEDTCRAFCNGPETTHYCPPNDGVGCRNIISNTSNCNKSCDQNGNEIPLENNQSSSSALPNAKRQFWIDTKRRVTQQETFVNSDPNGNSAINEGRSATDAECQRNDNSSTFTTDISHQADSEKTTDSQSETPDSGYSTSMHFKYLKRKRQKPAWMTSAGNKTDAVVHPLKPEIYHKGVRLSNYVCPEKRYLIAKSKLGNKKDLSVRWHASVGAMVNKHEISQEPMLAEKTFPKQARHRALHKMIEDNHSPPPDDDASKIQNEMLNSRIHDFLQSVEPYRKK